MPDFTEKLRKAVAEAGNGRVAIPHSSVPALSDSLDQKLDPLLRSLTAISDRLDGLEQNR